MIKCGCPVLSRDPSFLIRLNCYQTPLIIVRLQAFRPGIQQPPGALASFLRLAIYLLR